MGATARVAEWIVNTSYEDIPPAAIKKAEESCFDLIGCILAGATEDFGPIILHYAAKIVGRDLGNPFLIQERIGLKRFPCCGGSHSALEGFLSLMRDHNIQYDDVQWVDVDNISYLSPVMIYREVDDPLQGKFSMHYTIAAALLNGRVDVNSFQHKTFHDPRMKEAMAKVRLNVRAKWDLGGVSRDPGGNPIQIHLKDGRTLSRTVSGGEGPGSAMNPFSRDELELKFRANAALSLPPDKVEEATRVWSSIGEIQGPWAGSQGAPDASIAHPSGNALLCCAKCRNPARETARGKGGSI
ncbi:MAG: hypothetical protein ACE5JL_06970 [Dehalococcoidia bacterium]